MPGGEFRRDGPYRGPRRDGGRERRAAPAPDRRALPTERPGRGKPRPADQARRRPRRRRPVEGAVADPGRRALVRPRAEGTPVTLLEGFLIGAAIITALIAIGALGCDLVVDWWRRR